MTTVGRSRLQHGPFGVSRQGISQVPPAPRDLVIAYAKADVRTQVSNISFTTNNTYVELSSLLRVTITIPPNGTVEVLMSACVQTNIANRSIELATSIDNTNWTVCGGGYLSDSSSGVNNTVTGSWIWTGLTPGKSQTFYMGWGYAGVGVTWTVQGNVAGCFGTWHSVFGIGVTV